MNREKIEFLQPEKLYGTIEETIEYIRRGVPSTVFGVNFPLKCLLASFVNIPLLYVTDNYNNSLLIKEEIEDISGKDVVVLNAKDDVLLFKEAFAKDSFYKRQTAIYQIINGAEIIIADVESLLQLCPKTIKNITLKRNSEYNFVKLSRIFAEMGYTKVDKVESKGSFSVRGDIIDVYPINEEKAYRLDFFGDYLEAIKPYDAVTSEKFEEIKEVIIISATDILLDGENIKEIIDEFRLETEKITEIKAYERSRNIFNEIKELLENNAVSAKLSFILPLLTNSVSVFSLLKENTTIFFDECKLLTDKIKVLYKEHDERLRGLKAGGEAFSFSKFQLLSEDDFFEQTAKFKNVALQNFLSQNPFFNSLKTISIKSTQAQKYLYNIEALAGDIVGWQKNGYKVALFTETFSKAEKLYDVLKEKGIKSAIVKDYYLNNTVNIFSKKLARGILLHENKISVIGSGDLYAKLPTQKRIKKKRNDLFISPEIGDYAVHEVHGIGKITGTKKIETTEGTKDYIALEYKCGDTLYVPVEQMDSLSKYMGDGNPGLSRIGGKEFERVKLRVMESIKKLAIDLKTLYSEREAAKGFVFSEDNELMAEFENLFAFEPTPDQISSINEIKQDMESDKVMDRLLCGDVGYGKTEVALRAAYKAINDGKQVAFLCPTTILSQQHYNTCISRFNNLGIRVEVLNRFKSVFEQNSILNRLKNGEVDLLVGTHRILSKDIVFKDLGLLILDEEQRFGVEHKEKIKLLKTNVDCLTMTATPIPRTLYMSLAGIRDISTIETPPKERLPIQTYVVEETESLIRDACIRELSRGGQVFILYNRVESIYQFASKIREIVPEAKVSITHGRMSEQELENNIFEFFENHSNILITTTIIENGIDLPNANTIIVIDSDRLGISQLYQLRGRVGRSNRLASAYFTYKADKVLTNDAASRLSAIMEFTELGSGFKIAMRDLEIRGAGNVLGKEQHGHIEKIGFELYSKLLKEEMNGEKDSVMELDIKMTAYIPDNYIESSSNRLDCYKKIAEIKDIKDYKMIAESIKDNYGKIPISVKNLLDIALLKSYAHKISAIAVNLTGKFAEIVLPDLKSLQNEKLLDMVTKYKRYVFLKVVEKPILYFTKENSNQLELIQIMLKFLHEIVTFTNLT